MANGNGFTPTEQRIIDVLSDGMRHKQDELLKCIEDELATPSNLYSHISRIRKKIHPIGRDVVCRVTGWRRQYQLMSMIKTDDD